MKPSKKAKQLLKKLENVKEMMFYFGGNSDHWTDINDTFKDLEDYLIENSKSQKLHDIELAKKIKEDLT